VRRRVAVAVVIVLAIAPPHTAMAQELKAIGGAAVIDGQGATPVSDAVIVICGDGIAAGRMQITPLRG